jgi:GNAT superfamily N-acetyltransferase
MGFPQVPPSAGRDGVDGGTAQRDRRAERERPGGAVDGWDEVRLRDGTSLLVRPIRPGDAGALVALHARLSTDTIYRRYFGVRPHLSPADVLRFTNVDGRARFALVGVRDGDLAAVARYEGDPAATTAEIAVVVDDALQHRGVGRLLLGRLLLGRLVDIAHENGFATLTADVLAGNRAMLGLLRALGLPQRTKRDMEVTTVVTDLTGLEPTEDRRDRARRHIASAGRAVPSG